MQTAGLFLAYKTRAAHTIWVIPMKKLSMKKRFLLLFILLACVLVPFVSYTATNRTSPLIRENNKKLAESIQNLPSGETHLNDVASFDWDYLYSFPADTSKEAIIEQTQVSSPDGILSPGTQDDVNLFFVKGDAIVASICGKSENLKYRLSLDAAPSRYVCISRQDNPPLTVERSGEIVTLKLPDGYDPYIDL